MATLAELLKNLTPEQQHYIARLVASLPETEGGLNLPLSNTAMDRAKAMGGIDVYHGTASDIRNIDPKMFGASTGAESAKKAFWTVSDPNTARGYAEYAARDVPVKRLIDLAHEAEKKGDWDLYDDYIRQAEEHEAAMEREPFAGQNIMPLMQLGSKKLAKDFGGAEFTDVQSDINKYLSKAKASGASEAVLQNLADDVYFSGRPATHYATFKPETLRSRFAAFNPWRKGEADLLASHPLASAGAALSATGGLSGMARDYLSEPYDPGNQYAQFGLKPPISKGEALKGAVSAVPGIGEVLSGAEGLQAASEGKWKEAGLGALGAAGLMPSGGIAGIFAGSGAATANKAMLTRANAMEKIGKSPEQIWSETGWFKAPWDKQWRFEIPDEEAKFGFVPQDRIGPLSKVFKHKGLSEAYPSVVEKTQFNYANPASMPGFNAGYIHNYPGGPLVLLSQQSKLDQAGKSSVLHELQHAIQEYEKFGLGGTKEAVEQYATANNLDPYDVYRRLAGEAEARLVQKRHMYTPEKRKSIFPLTEMAADIPLNELIYSKR
jgi:hypothetical protein